MSLFLQVVTTTTAEATAVARAWVNPTTTTTKTSAVEDPTVATAVATPLPVTTGTDEEHTAGISTTAGDVATSTAGVADAEAVVETMVKHALRRHCETERDQFFPPLSSDLINLCANVVFPFPENQANLSTPSPAPSKTYAALKPVPGINSRVCNHGYLFSCLTAPGLW
jgi:hypothetical protein